MGDEPPTPTPVLETGLEVGADRDAAKSPQISRQQVATVHPPTPGLPAAPQPPLSAVRTSPKRNAPFEGTPTDSENSLLKRYGYHSTQPVKPDSYIPKLYGYYGSEPSPDPPEKEEEAADRSASWWFVLMVGIVAFSGGFFGNFLRGKAK